MQASKMMLAWLGRRELSMRSCHLRLEREGDYLERVCHPFRLGNLLGLVTYSLVFLNMILVH